MAGAFYGLNGESLDLERAMKTYSHQIPPDSIPLADGDGGNQFLIMCGRRNASQVVFWDHEIDELNNENLSLCATSFVDFVLSFEERPEERSSRVSGATLRMSPTLMDKTRLWKLEREKRKR